MACGKELAATLRLAERRRHAATARCAAFPTGGNEEVRGRRRQRRSEQTSPTGGDAEARGRRLRC